MKIIMSMLMHFFRIYFMLLTGLVLYSQNHANFKHLSLKHQGKTHISNHCVQDNLGNIWFSNKDGILKFDGYEFSFISVKHIFDKSTEEKLSNISKDLEDNIWLTSNKGNVTRYGTNGIFNRIETDSIGKVNKVICLKDQVFFIINNNEVHSYSKSGIKNLIKITDLDNSSESINSLALNKTGDLYIATTKGKLYTYSLHNKIFRNLKSLFTNYAGILTLTFDHNDNLWIGTETSGLFAYDIKNNSFFQNEVFKDSSFDLSKEIIYSLFCDHKGCIWVGTDGSGLYQIDPVNKKIFEHSSYQNNKYSLSSNTILSFYEDDQNNLWVITNYGDINILSQRDNKIRYHSGSDNNQPQRVLSIIKSKANETWIGTDGNGLTRIIPQSNGQNRIINYFKKDKNRKGFYIQSIAEDTIGNIWIGTYKNGLWVMNKKTQKFKKISIKDINNLKSNDIRTVFIDSKARIWVSTEYKVIVFSSDQNILAQFENNKYGLKGIIAESFIEDYEGNIWIGFYLGGLFKFNENPNNFNNSKFEIINFNNKNQSNYLQGAIDMSINKDCIWLVNPDGILFSYNYKNKNSQSFKKFKSFKNIRFVSIEKDKQDNLWLGTNDGILFFNPKDSTIIKYNENDGLRNNRFLYRSSFRDKDEILYFGNNEGVVYFDPLILKKKESKPNLHFSAIEILNKPAEKIIPEQLENGINNIKHLLLKYNQSSFSFKFSAIDNVFNPNFNYSYKLKGFDKDWISNTQNRMATYTNIPPGDYIFEVKAGSEIGKWNVPSKSISITIEKPWWNHSLFYLFNILIIASLLYLLNHWYNMRKQMITKELIYKKENELHNLKMDFFTRMSHEIQTPLTLIGGPIEDMLLKSKQNENLLLHQRLKIISNNVKRLSKIAFELTTVRNKDLGRLKLLVKNNNLCEEINNISLSFKEEARIKKIDFTSICPQNLKEAWYDKDKIEHIIFNLLSNAFKFTPKNGNIQLNIIPIKSKDMIKISITDSGPGIPTTDLKNIFTLFYQTNLGKKMQGTGIGLTLTKELIDLHRGKIEVTSSNEEGTCFTITLPIAETNYNDSEKIMTDEPDEELNLADLDISTSDDIEIPIDKSRKTILVVEDNFELQLFLKDLLIDQYNIILADNGEEGLNYAKSNTPDLILSDIMMPKMDGIEMCKLLQINSQTNHIPIILITAKNSSNSKIQGLKSGAIEFINKPFNTKELQLKIRNIISSKDHIISKYKKESISNPEINFKKTQDEKFLEDLVVQINIRIDKGNFKLNELADSLHMSYSTLYRKCQAVTGNNLVDFVRLFRLKKGAVILVKYGHSIADAAYRVGFNDPKYFSKCFKKEFGLTPKKFKNEALKNGSEKHLKKYNLNDIT